MPTVNSPSKYRLDQRSTYTRSDTPGVVYVLANTRTDASFGSGQDSRTTTSNPYWRKQIVQRTDASTSYFRSEHSITVPRISCETRSVSNSPRIIGNNTMVFDGSGVFGPWPATDAALQDIALTRIKRKLKTQIGSMDVVIPVAELRELRLTIRGLALLATQMLVTMSEIKRTKGASAFKYASAAWLTFNFGVSPLIRDADSITKAIIAFLERKDSTPRLRATAYKDWKSSHKSVGTTGAFGASVSGYTDVYHKLSYKYTAGFNLPLSTANNYTMSEHLGFELPTLFPAAWELTPFSWVFDYFGTIGAFLDDTYTSPPGSTIYVVLNRKYTAEANTDMLHVPSVGFNITGQIKGHSVIRYWEFQRTPLGQLPRLGLRFRTQDEVGKHVVSKLLNLASVLGVGIKTLKPLAPARIKNVLQRDFKHFVFDVNKL